MANLEEEINNIINMHEKEIEEEIKSLEWLRHVELLSEACHNTRELQQAGAVLNNAIIAATHRAPSPPGPSEDTFCKTLHFQLWTVMHTPKGMV